MGPWVAPAIIAGAGALMNIIGQRRSRTLNERYVRDQNTYNSPRSQMMRYQAAGLNPALIYSQGSPGNQPSALSAPQGMQSVGSDFVSSYNQSAMAQSQVAFQRANVARTKVLTELNKLQTEVLSKNPYLNPEALEAIISSLKSTAASKMAQAGVDVQTSEYLRGVKRFEVGGKPTHEGPAGVVKMEMELNRLIQQFDLGTSDQKIKAEVLQSKEFANELQKIQLDFLNNFEVTPAHILEFVKILLMKLK